MLFSNRQAASSLDEVNSEVGNEMKSSSDAEACVK